MKANVLSDPLVFDDTTRILVRKSTKSASIKKLYVVSAICFTFMITELIGGFLSNSLAIMTDAAHMLADLSGFAISVASIVLSSQLASREMSYGYHRAEVVGALMSISLVLILTCFLLYEAIYRIIAPKTVDGFIMFITAMIGLVSNIIMGSVLHKKHNHKSHGDINIKAASLHVLGDFLQSIGVILASILILINPEWSLADPLCTFVFSIIVIFTTFPIIKECFWVLMEAAPHQLDIKLLKESLEKVIFN